MIVSKMQLAISAIIDRCTINGPKITKKEIKRNNYKLLMNNSKK